ncbi:MAG: hypothetical protein IPK79_02200 [Vampirovibrionales bacterium]|nr:hypothetical protein [Vampirovibrionales bacterium]
MMKKMHTSPFDRRFLASLVALLMAAASCGTIAYADGEATTTSTPGSTTVNTGITNGSILGSNNLQATQTGVALNGANNGNLSNNANYNVGGSNTLNSNPVLYSPNTSGGGSGGNSALVLPRNPLALPNANLGRSNFGLQFGVQNNPGMAALTGSQNALGWFLQGGVTIPFGKIPDVLANANTTQLDARRERARESDRRVFGDLLPQGRVQAVKTSVEGQIVPQRLNAYNFSTLPAGKIDLGSSSISSLSGTPAVAAPQPKLLALEPGDVFARPMDAGDKIGVVEVGREYPYLGHLTNEKLGAGWVKLLMPNGQEGWTRTPFEYLKFDYTQIDKLAVETTGHRKTASSK